ncbi:MAG: glycine--tRNA ligase subunit beta [Anaerolineae bacterium]|nr:glycine--tRNA ligase subunit beta [Anaerolineae bacterium]
MTAPLSFQEVILRLQRYWAEHGCTIWQPYSEKVGAGTYNPATVLRVLGPEPWNVAYVEPSFRPDDGRYGENPNRMQMHFQFQVILKPDPGDPQELYLGSLEAIGIDRLEHDLRFVEDNWESPALGAWGLGWEVWMDGQEISQYTYFQQAGGYALDPVSVELTYGLERIVMSLQHVRSVWEIDWDGTNTYADILLRPEIEHCTYDFEVADVERMAQLYNLYEAEAQACLAKGLVIPAHDYVLRCSHTFNLLDARGAIGVTERAQYFARMRNLSRQVAKAYVALREEMGYPMLRTRDQAAGASPVSAGPPERAVYSDAPETFLLEIGTEELPAGDVADALAQLATLVPQMLHDLRLEHGPISVEGTPRRLAVRVERVAPRQPDREMILRGPPASQAYDQDGSPTRAAQGFARSKGIPVEALQVRDVEGGQYVVAVVHEYGQPAGQVLAGALADLVATLSFGKSMRWNASGVAFSRPIRWFVALLGSAVVPFAYAGLHSARVTRGLRMYGSPAIQIPDAASYLAKMAAHEIVVDVAQRREMIRSGAERLAAEVDGVIPDDPALLDEITHLVERPTPLRGAFEPEYLSLPAEILISVMKTHQRYLPVVGAPGTDRADQLLPYFVTVRNGDDENLEIVRQGNEDVIRARFADAQFFFAHDTRQHLANFLPRLATLTFQEQLGSMLDKVRRLERLAPRLGEMLGLCAAELMTVQRAANLCKADLATQMVVEMTSLQGIMGREYARRSGEPDAVAEAIYEHYLPRFADDALPRTKPGIVISLADRLDSLVGLFAVGLAPSGTKDPFALRRAALGIVQVLLGNALRFDLKVALARAAKRLPVQADADVQQAVLDYIAQRLRGVLLDSGVRYDVADAVLAARSHDPYWAAQAASALGAWVEAPDWMDLLNAYARCVRIVRDQESRYPVEPAHLTEPASTALWQALQEAQEALPADEPGVDDVLSAIRGLVPAINRFFNDVLVMDPDLAVRENRLGLVQSVAALTDGIVDLSRLEGF